MDLTKMIADLQSERERLDEAILALERLAANKGKRRGRPPKWLVSSNQAAGGAASEMEEAAPEVPLTRAAGKRG
jgi:hypothetical protein